MINTLPTFTARSCQTEREWNVLQDVRDNWLGLGVATVFRSWKKWVREQLRERRRDRRAKLRAKINVRLRVHWRTALLHCIPLEGC